MKSNLFVLLFAISLISCHSVKKMTIEKGELENITEGKLLRNIEANELVFNTLYSKKMDITLDTKKKSSSLKATMQIKRDNFIYVSMTAALGINVARLLLTPDSVKFINIHNNEYFVSDYSYFLHRFDLNLSFDCFQRILSNHFFNFESCTSSMDKAKRYRFDKSGDKYKLYTLEEKALGRKLKKLYKKKRKNKDYSLILQEILIDPDNFRPSYVSIEDVDEQIGLDVTYRNFKNFIGRIYPEEIIFNFFTDSDEFKVKIVFDRIEFDVDVKPSFKILSKYKRIY